MMIRGLVSEVLRSSTLVLTRIDEDSVLSEPKAVPPPMMIERCSKILRKSTWLLIRIIEDDIQSEPPRTDYL